MRSHDLIERLHDIFSRIDNGRGHRGHADDFYRIATALNSGAATFRLTRVPALAVKRAQAACPFQGCVSESPQHAFLKAVAVEWMKIEGGKDAVSESQFANFRLDAYSEQLRWAIECGHTSPGKALLFARLPKPVRMTLLPFRSHVGPRVTQERAPVSLLGVEVQIAPEYARALEDHRLEKERQMLERVWRNMAVAHPGSSASLSPLPPLHHEETI